MKMFGVVGGGGLGGRVIGVPAEPQPSIPSNKITNPSDNALDAVIKSSLPRIAPEKEETGQFLDNQYLLEG
jgi:hypothetical protein